MRVIYLIQTFDSLPQIQRLVATILASDPAGRVIVSHNSDGYVMPDDAFGNDARVDIMNMPGGNRVDFYQAETYLKALEFVRDRGIPHDWVMNLTGQCYPTRSLREFGQYLSNGDVDGYVFAREVFAAQGGLWPAAEASARYHYRYHWRLTLHELSRPLHLICSLVREVVNRTQPWVRIDTSYALQVGVRDRRAFLPPGWRLYGGFIFMALNVRAADRLLAFAAQHPQEMQHFRLMNLPSEVFAHTVLCNDPTIRLSDDVPLYVDYSNSPRGRPRVLTSADVDALDRTGCFFARKFVLSVDAGVLDLLDARVLEGSPPAHRQAAA